MNVIPEIMIPLVCDVKELKFVKNIVVRTPSLKSQKNTKEVVFDFPGFPVFAIRSKADDSPFVCLALIRSA